MSKKITQQDILDMAVHKREPDMAADVDKDGKITPEDARLAPDGIDAADAVMAQDILDRLMNEPAYVYEQEEDPLYRQYRDMYERAGEKAAENAFGLAASYTGGYGNTYAATAANDAYALYMDRLAAKGEALEQKAYDRYRDDRADLYRRLEAAQQLEDRDYDRERDKKEDGYRDEELRLKQQAAEQNSLDALIRFAFDAAGQGDYAYLAALGVDPAAMTEKDALAKAELYAKYGDLSKLEQAGVNVGALKAQAAKDDAAFYAKYGDLSKLDEVGVDTGSLKGQEAMDAAAFYAKYGDWSKLAGLGVDTRSLQQQAIMDKAAFYAKYGDLSGLSKMGVDVSRLKKEQLFDVAALFAKYGNYSLFNLLV